MLRAADILYEDNHLLVVNKPAGIATMGAEAGKPTMARLSAEYLKHKYHKPGNVFIGIVSRLDSLVSGALIFARTSKAASRISDQMRRGTIDKRYLAIVASRPPTPEQADWKNSKWIELHSQLRKNERLRKMETVTQGDGGQAASLRFRQVAEATSAGKSLRLLEIELLTGRKHQIRVQLADMGWPVLGDTKYDSDFRLTQGIALHCYRVTILHPTKRDPLQFQAPPRPHWEQFGKVIPLPLLKALDPLNQSS